MADIPKGCKILQHVNTKQTKIFKESDAKRFLKTASWVEVDEKGNVKKSNSKKG